MLHHLAIGATLALLAIAATGCSGGDGEATPAETSSCSDVFYEGEGAPDALIVSDMPLGRDPSGSATIMVDAIQLVLRQRGFRAGERRIGYQSCTYTEGRELSGRLCERNARTYAATEDVLGVVGPLNSGCAEIQIPLLSREEIGPLAMVSPANTYVGLTRRGPGASPEHPGSLYPNGVRNYVRVVGPDSAQGAALAQHAKDSGMRRVVALYDPGDEYAVGISKELLRTARSLRLEAWGLDWREQWDNAALVRRIARLQPELVYLTGPGDGQQAYVKQFLEAVRAALGPRAVVAGSDNFGLPGAIEELGPTGEGLLVTAVGVPSDSLPTAGKAFLAAFGKDWSPVPGDFGAPEAAQAAEVLLDAIARSDGTRASVVEELFETEVKEGILGSFHFDENGDIAPAAVTVYRIEDGKAVPQRVVSVPPARDR